MATVNNVVIPNIPKGPGTDDAWPHFWAGTRAMKKAGWKYLASGDGTSKNTSADPSADLWNGTAPPSVGTGSAASFDSSTSGGRLTITGLSGITDASKGRFLTFTGTNGSTNDSTVQIEEIVSASEVRVNARNFVFTLPEANNGAVVWAEDDPTDEALPAGLASVAAWWLAQGPSILKIPITSAVTAGPSGFEFLRGENVVQATTGAEGEILGSIFDSIGSTGGYLVIAPRVIGTGSGIFGWETGNTVTGDTSQATVDQDGTALEYRNQVMIGKNSADPQDFGKIYHQCIEPVGESADDFATLAVSSGCTATLQPGGGGTGNAFPALAWVNCGESDSILGQHWSGSNSSPAAGNGQAIAVDAIFESGYSADGTWAVHTTAIALAGTPQMCRGFYRMDDTEPGDLSPYVSFGPCSTSLYNANGRIDGFDSSSIGSADYMNTTRQDLWGTGLTAWKGWRRRGLVTDDSYQAFELGCQFTLQTSPNPITETNTGDSERVATEPNPTKAREPIRLVSVENLSKMRKGTVRHLSIIQGGNGLTTYDGGKFLQLSPTHGCFVASPWDETTVPLPS